MAFTLKQWLNKVGSGTQLDAPNEGAQTPMDAAALRDMETRLSTYTDTVGSTPGPAGAQGPAGPQGNPGPATVYVQAGAPVNPPANSIWFVSPDGGVTITAMHVAVPA